MIRAVEKPPKDTKRGDGASLAGATPPAARGGSSWVRTQVLARSAKDGRRQSLLSAEQVLGVSLKHVIAFRA